jgi:hypothetical protein
VALDELSQDYTQNPYRNPLARVSYVGNPEAYDDDTGDLGPDDDTTELMAIQPFTESSALLLTQRACYIVTEVGESEPENWPVRRIADECGLASANALAIGTGWAMWGGKDAAWLFGGLAPTRASNGIEPDWQRFTPQWVTNDPTEQRVYFGGLDSGNPPQQKVWLYDYHEGIQAGKWAPWTVPAVFGAMLPSGMSFTAGSNIYTLNATKDEDDDYGEIASKYVTGPIAPSALRKLYAYLAAQLSGTATMSIGLARDESLAVVKTTRELTLMAAPEGTVELGLNLSGRFVFLVFAPTKGRFRLEGLSVNVRPDPMAPVTGRF